jgi:hypothetical protein
MPHPHHGSPEQSRQIQGTGGPLHLDGLDSDLSQLFDHNDPEQITQIVFKMKTTMPSKFDASELLQQLDQLDKPFQSAHWLFSLAVCHDWHYVSVYLAQFCSVEKVLYKI